MREDIIVNFFMSLKKHYNYAIIHHVDEIFENTSDIDFVVNCSKSELHAYILNYCLENGFYFVHHTIDLGVERYNLICFNQTEIIKIELDITYSNNNILGIDVQTVLKNLQTKYVKGNPINVFDPRDEYLFYLKKKAFKKSEILEYFNYFQKLSANVSKEDIQEQYQEQRNYFNSLSFRFKLYSQKAVLLYYRIFEKPSETICFLGPDGSGKTTIIEGVRKNNPYVNFIYYHLKPKKKKNQNDRVETNPHQKDNYSTILSLLKLCYFVFEYNINWIRNILPKKITPVLIVFDRYFDDIFADPKRYRYGSHSFALKIMRKFIPRPNITLILDAPADVILNRKKEVSKESLILQLEKYRALGNKKNYYIVDVNRPVGEIIKDVIKIILIEKKNE